MTFLDDMAASSRQRLAEAKRLHPVSALEHLIAAAAPPRPLAAPAFLLIAEIKRTSPALGPLDQAAHPISRRAQAYADASAISVLTEPSRFGGSLDDLREVAAATHLPVMRKDFLLDPYQVLEARAAGASGILLIVRILSDLQLADMLHAAARLRMFVLLEAFDEHDARRTFLTPPPGSRILVGVNTRDLATLQVQPDRLKHLRPCLPPSLPAIAESGLHSPADIADAARCGYDGALVGGALMRAQDPAALCRNMLAAALAARSST